jgi:NAD-dependent DNA ligase
MDLKGKRVHVTGKVEGYTKATLKELVEGKGCVFANFSKKTELLVVGDKPGQAKLDKAGEWGIETMPVATFLDEVGA